MAWLSNTILDGALNILDTSGTRLDICSTSLPQDGATYAECTSTYSLGSATINIPAPSERGAGGREVIVPSISNGSVSSDGTAVYFAITNGSDTVYAVGSLSSSQAVTNGNTFTLTSFTIGIPNPA